MKTIEFVIDLDNILPCKCCGAEIAQLEGLPPEDLCVDCDDSEVA